VLVLRHLVGVEDGVAHALQVGEQRLARLEVLLLADFGERIVSDFNEITAK
jgi:hypothetical protein